MAPPRSDGLSASSRLPPPPSFDLHGRRALVTGAGRGIGFAASCALAQAGAHVVLAARSDQETAHAADALKQAGFSAESVKLDVTDVAAVQETVAGFGPFDILVNNAGTNRPALVQDVTEDDFDAVMALNVRAAYFVAQAVAKRLIAEKRQGSLINVSSQMGLVGGAQRSIYCASKHAMEGFTKAMAIDLGPYGIRVNSLCPTFLETPLTRPFLADLAFREDVLRRIKLGRVGQVRDIVGAIVFLASDSSALMTGSALVVDGGWTAE
jgi:NAD(P)-dependent dehydrogenase (short-subunit alcohol dehydrogenase family)